MATKKKKPKSPPTYDSLIGQTVKKAMTTVSKIDSRITTLRVSKRDGQPCMLTMDMRPNRLNVETENELISRIHGIG